MNTMSVPSVVYHDPDTGAVVSVDALHAEAYHQRHPALVPMDGTASVPPARAPVDASWLTITEAARMHMADKPGTDLEEAKKRVTRAVDAGKIKSAGQKRNRLIDPGVGTLAEWRLRQRDRELDREDDR